MKMEKVQDVPWLCDRCKKELIPGKVRVRYLEGNFEVELMKCPSCNMVYIGEDTASGVMLEVEKELEDK